MHAGLLVASMLLIAVGIFSGLSPLVVIGFFALLAGLSLSRRSYKPIPKSEMRKTSPSLKYEAVESPPPATAKPVVNVPETRSDALLLPPLFPSQIFPTLNPVQFSVEEGRNEEKKEKEIELDEVIQIAAIFFLGRFFSRRG